MVLSYSGYEENTGARPRVMTVSDIMEAARKVFKSVRLVPAGRMAHSKLNKAELNKAIVYNAESLIICTP
jgi:hypothetical protein